MSCNNKENNYTVAKKRSDYLQKQLTKSKNLIFDYDKVVKQCLKEGIVEYDRQIC